MEFKTVSAVELIKKFNDQGYLIFDNEIDPTILEGCKNDLAIHWGHERKVPIHVPYSDCGRIQDAWHISQYVLDIATAPKVLQILEILYNQKPKPFQTLIFCKGTEQAIHSDTIHFNSKPFGLLCGVWVALEDIGLDQGPLVYYPQSHELPEMNYEDFNLQPDQESYRTYTEKIVELINKNKYRANFGIMRKGECIV